MQCMKCGRDVEAGQVFCEMCLADMEKYPVKPGTAVVLPHYPERVLPKRPAKRVLTNEEQLRRARRMNRILAVLLAVYMVAVAGLGYLYISQHEEFDGKYLPGQNYSAAEPEETTEATDGGI